MRLKLIIILSFLIGGKVFAQTEKCLVPKILNKNHYQFTHLKKEQSVLVNLNIDPDLLEELGENEFEKSVIPEFSCLLPLQLNKISAEGGFTFIKEDVYASYLEASLGTSIQDRAEINLGVSVDVLNKYAEANVSISVNISRKRR